MRAPKGTPNVLFVVLDDTGFGRLGCYGSPIETPNFDRLAADGLRSNKMHTTALCSPSRSCIVPGRNHRSNGMACITETASGYPGYNGIVPFENGFLSETLLGHGYDTYMGRMPVNLKGLTYSGVTGEPGLAPQVSHLVRARSDCGILERQQPAEGDTHGDRTGTAARARLRAPGFPR